MTRIALALATVALLGASTTAHAKKKKQSEPLTMTAGTMQLGGTVNFDLYLTPDTTYIFTIAPSAGYFVADNIELEAGIGLTLYDGGNTVGLGLGGKYWIDSDPLWIYVGGEFGYNYTNSAFGALATLFGGDIISLGVPAGILYPLSKNVGLDVGGKIEILLPDGGDMVMHVPLGYLGVQAFFK